jgi:hypothetical protein
MFIKPPWLRMAMAERTHLPLTGIVITIGIIMPGRDDAWFILTLRRQHDQDYFGKMRGRKIPAQFPGVGQVKAEVQEEDKRNHRDRHKASFRTEAGDAAG